jgi:hypothetical protein
LQGEKKRWQKESDPDKTLEAVLNIMKLKLKREMLLTRRKMSLKIKEHESER